jgi:SPP1 gp7 family putative phage head morphogenesis protein
VKKLVGILNKTVTMVLDFFGRRQLTELEPNQKDNGRTLDRVPMVSYAESPSLYVYEQFKVATDRISIIREVNELVKKDLRFKITNNRLAADAARGGFNIIVSGSDADRARMKKKGKTVKRLSPGANIAQQVIDDFLKRTKLQAKSKEYARVLPRDGDLFLNPLVDLSAGLVLDVRRAPALTIKRNSDEFGEFPDIERSFSQIDPKTQIQSLMEIGPPQAARTNFALFQMNHIRWMEEETEMYGTSHYASARATYKILNKMEVASAIRREFRSVQKFGHKLPEGTQEKDTIEYMRLVGLIDAEGRPTRNSHLLSDFVGTAEVKVLNGDQNLDQMGDIKYFEDLLWLNLGVPKAIVTSGQDMNRDVLKVQYPHYLRTLEDVTDLIENGDTGQFSGLRAIVDLQLLLAGINPDAIRYDIVWNDKTDETALERLERVQRARGADKGGGVVLITLEKAIQEIANDYDIEDAADMAAQIQEEEHQKNLQIERLKANNSSNEQTPTQGQKTPQSDDMAVTDVALEDRSEFEDIELEARGKVLRFFGAVYRGMTDIVDTVLTDSVNDIESVMNAFGDSWDAEEGKYRVGILKSMTETALMGAQQAAVLTSDFQKSSLLGVDIKPRIVKTDIRDDLMSAAGDRIRGIKETTRDMIRETLVDGFEANLGWKEIKRQLGPIIKDPVRAETISISELSWAYVRGEKRVYRDAGFEKVQLYEIIDMKTCAKCKARHGRIIDIDSPEAEPIHPRCRVTLLPA